MITIVALAVAINAQPDVVLGTGPKMCAALTVEDFKAAGLSPDATPPRPPNSDDATNAYCSYTKAFPVAGGLELDIFDGERDPAAVVKTILAESGRPRPAGLPNVDESLLTLSPGDKGVTIASIVVRHRRLVFAVSIPSTPNVREQLVALAQKVLTRVEH